METILLVKDERGLARVIAPVEAPSVYPNLTSRENLEATRRLAEESSRRSLACCASFAWTTPPAGRCA